MDKQTIIDKFLEKNDLKEHELVYWKHKCSNGFELKKFMGDFINYYNEQLNTPTVNNRRELLLAFVDWFVNVDDSTEMFPTQSSVEQFLNKQ